MILPLHFYTNFLKMKLDKGFSCIFHSIQNATKLPFYTKAILYFWLFFPPFFGIIVWTLCYNWFQALCTDICTYQLCTKRIYNNVLSFRPVTTCYAYYASVWTFSLPRLTKWRIHNICEAQIKQQLQQFCIFIIFSGSS